MAREKRQMLGGIWNLRHGRDDREAANECLVIMAELGLDYLLLSETAEYVDELAALPGMQLVHFDDEPGQRDTAILVRNGVEISGLCCKKATKTGWITIRGGHTPPKWIPSVVLDRWLRVYVVHYAPSVRHKGDRSPDGPFRRVISVVQHAKAEVDFVRRRRPDRCLVGGGDRNDTPSDRGWYTPAWIAERADMDIVRPNKPTHGARTIDFPLTRNVTTVATSHEKHGSDHRVVALDTKEL